MIILFTGVPGAGKTLNAIKFIAEDPQFKDRPVYYFGIKELTLPWTQLTDQEVKEWYDLPRGAVIVIDECQNVFPLRNVRAEAPVHVSHLNTHRHYGMDIVLITQHPRLLDSSVRPLVGQHQHFERKYGWSRVKRITFEKCQENTDARSARDLAQIKQVQFDKKYYGVYKSAEVHTHKARVPLKLVAALAFLALIVPGWLWLTADHLGERVDPDDVNAGVTSSESRNGAVETPIRSKQKTADEIAVLPLDSAEYMKLYKPRIMGVPATAPIYDNLTQPVEAPKTYCVSWRSKDGVDNCECYTQQITQVNMPFQACKNIVNNRMWDPTLSTQKYNSGGQMIEG